MTLPGKSKGMLDLETDLALTPEDFQAMSPPALGLERDLARYLAFLDEIGVFESKKVDAKVYPEEFEL